MRGKGDHFIGFVLKVFLLIKFNLLGMLLLVEILHISFWSTTLFFKLRKILSLVFLSNIEMFRYCILIGLCGWFWIELSWFGDLKFSSGMLIWFILVLEQSDLFYFKTEISTVYAIHIWHFSLFFCKTWRKRLSMIILNILLSMMRKNTRTRRCSITAWQIEFP